MESKQYNFEEIEPFCNWRREEEQDVLEVQLQGFKKDQLKVQINNLGVLTISGERSPDENRRVRFRKEISVSKDCKRDEIRARFSGGVLYLTMPKRTISPVATQTQPAPGQVQNQENGKQKQSVDKDKQTNDKTAAGATQRISGPKCAVPMVEMRGKTALKLGALAAVVVAVAIGAYVAYKYREAFHVEE